MQAPAQKSIMFWWYVSSRKPPTLYALARTTGYYPSPWLMLCMGDLVPSPPGTSLPEMSFGNGGAIGIAGLCVLRTDVVLSVHSWRTAGKENHDGAQEQTGHSSHQGPHSSRKLSACSRTIIIDMTFYYTKQSEQELLVKEQVASRLGRKSKDRNLHKVGSHHNNGNDECNWRSYRSNQRTTDSRRSCAEEGDEG
jgi:hypothetical protein